MIEKEVSWRGVYEKIVKVLKNYLDLREDYYHLIAVWVIGTYFHKYFLSYPYLFFNAPKRSGKTRLLKLIAELSEGGKMLVSLRDSVFFRSDTTLCIDEFEDISSKERATLRELLCAAYKKGARVERAYKIKTKSREKFGIESFDVYRALAIANVRGMDHIIEDRCIFMILERSLDPKKTKLLENFENDPDIKEIKDDINLLLIKEGIKGGEGEGSSDSSDGSDGNDAGGKYIYTISNIFNLWNGFLNKYYTILEHYLTSDIYDISDTTVTTDTNKDKENDGLSIERLDVVKKTIKELIRQEAIKNMDTELTQYYYLFDYFIKIYYSGISSRELELFFPLFVIAMRMGDDVFDRILEIAKNFKKEKEKEEMVENRDYVFLKFIVEEFEDYDQKDFIYQKDIAARFKEREGEEWISNEWVGRAIKRLGILLEKKRTGKGRVVRIDIKKAKEKARMLGLIEKEKQEEKEEQEEENEENKNKENISIWLDESNENENQEYE